MFCSNCGKDIPESATFCPACGVQCGGNTAAAAPKPAAPTEVIPSHLALGIISTLLCCLPFGIVSIVYAAQVSGLVSSGNLEGARAASRNAKRWGLAAIFVGGGLALLYVLAYVVMIVVAANASGA